MGQQQLLLIILGVIVVGIAIAVGISLFSAQSVQSNKDAIINDLNNIGAHAYQYKIRPSSMGGGEGNYKNFKLPTKLAENENATYVATATDSTVVLTATSKLYTNSTIEATVLSTGKLYINPDKMTNEFALTK